MTAASAKQIYSLIGKYVKLYTEKYEIAPTINRYREKWGFESMIEDLGYERAQEVITYYFATSHPGHPVNYLLFNYDRLSKIIDEKAEDEENRKLLRKQTEQLVREWDEKHGN